MKILPYFTLLILILSCSCAHQQEQIDAGKAELIRADLDWKEYNRRIEEWEKLNPDKIKDTSPFSLSYNPDLRSEIPFPDPIKEPVSLSEEEIVILNSELERIVEENQLTLQSSNPFCGYLDSSFEYKTSDRKIYLIELMYCRPALSIKLSSEKVNVGGDGDSYNIGNETIYSILLKKCSPEIQSQAYDREGE